MLPRSSTSQNAKSAAAKKSRSRANKPKGFLRVTAEALENLGQKIKDKFRWEHTPREFQIDAIKAQLQKKDVLVHAGTGAGKTFIAAGPHALDVSKGMVTFMVSSLIALQTEQVSCIIQSLYVCLT